MNIDPPSAMGCSGRSFPALWLHPITMESPQAAEDGGYFSQAINHRPLLKFFSSAETFV